MEQKIIEGVHFDESYSPICTGPSFHMTICFMAHYGMVITFIDAGNACQTNVISDPSKRHYVGLSSIYMEWF